MTPAETKELVRLLLALCPLKVPPITRDFARAWVAALEPYSYSQTRGAALEWARSKPYFPTVSDLTKKILPAAAGRNDIDLAFSKLNAMKG